MNESLQKDFRAEFYKQYFSTFRKFILHEGTFYNKSGFKAYRKQYLPHLNSYPKNAAIIDIGCGTGILLEFLRDSGFNNLFGIDLTVDQVNYAKEKGLNAEAISVFDFLKNTTKKFDIIFAMDLVEHFYKHELLDLFNGFYSLLNENGTLIIQTPNGDGLFHQHIIYGDLTHLTIFNANSLGQILRLTGFNDIKCFETGPTTKNLVGVIRLILWKVVRSFVQMVRIIETGGTEKILTQEFLCVARKGRG